MEVSKGEKNDDNCLFIHKNWSTQWFFPTTLQIVEFVELHALSNWEKKTMNYNTKTLRCGKQKNLHL